MREGNLETQAGVDFIKGVHLGSQPLNTVLTVKHLYGNVPKYDLESKNFIGNKNRVNL